MSMIVREIIKYLEDWAPPGAAWEKDNVGLQLGSRGQRIQNILLCLELDDEVLKEALRKKCNFIFTHHPFIFSPIKKIDIEKDSKAQLVQTILKNDITVYSAHTNLDFTKDGVSFVLAQTLKLNNIKFLEPEENNQYKVAVFVPEKDLEKVSTAVFNAGGGIIGEYENCSFLLKGEGTFKGSEKSNPAVGQKQKFEKVEEVRFEFIVDSWNLRNVINAIHDSHPYEEPAYDIYPLKNKNVNYGAGAIGELAKEMSADDFLKHTAANLKADVLKYSIGKSKRIKKVAVCGGSGSDLLNKAISAGADVFVTADVKYHTFQEATGKIFLIDAGHYETEIHSLDTVENKLKSFIPKTEQIKILKYSGSTNPIKFYKH